MSDCVDEFKKRLAEDFSKSADYYAKNAVVQKDACKELLSVTKEVCLKAFQSKENKNTFFLDIGCGCGFLLQEALALNLTHADVSFQVDISEEMCRVAQLSNGCRALCVDFEAKLSEHLRNKFSIIMSSFVLHWISDLSAAVQNAYRAAVDDGVFAFSVPVEGSLLEIGQFCEVYSFRSDEDFLRECERHFKVLKVEVKDFHEYYKSPLEAIKHIKNIGGSSKVNNFIYGDSESSSGYRRLRNATRFSGENFKITWKVLFCVCKKIGAKE